MIDGLDVLKRLEEAGEKLPKTIVISGYDEFEYARRAIELEVMAYLLKPLERSAVYEAVEKAVAALEKEQERKAQTRDGFTAGVENILTEYLRSPVMRRNGGFAALWIPNRGGADFTNWRCFRCAVWKNPP